MQIGNTEVELITAFTIKLREPIAKELISRDVKYFSLQVLISAAERFELHLPHLASNKPVEDFSTWESAVNYSGTFPRWPSRPQSKDTGSFNHARAHSQHSEHKVDKLNSSGIHSSGTRPRPNNFQSSSSQKSKEICLMFNKFKCSTCKLPNNQCANHRLHKCSFNYWACKACNHKSHSQGHFNKSKCNTYQGQAHVASNPSFSGKGAGDHDHSHPSRSPTEPSSNPQLTTVLSNMQQSLQSLSARMEKLKRPPNPVSSVPPQLPPGAVSGTDVLMQAPAYSCPAVTAIPNTYLFRTWILPINIFYGHPLHQLGLPFPSPLIAAAVCHW